MIRRFLLFLILVPWTLVLGIGSGLTTVVLVWVNGWRHNWYFLVGYPTDHAVTGKENVIKFRRKHD